jgi:hypothetical protein
VNIRSRRAAVLAVCLLVASQLLALPSASRPTSLLARFMTFVQGRLSPLVGTQSKLSPPIPAPAPSATGLTTTKEGAPQP